MPLVLQLLGMPQLFLDSRPIATDRRKAIALLVYLAVNDLGRSPQRYSRQALSALFWPDYEQPKAFSNLRRTIWEVHQTIGENWLIADRDSVQVNADAEIDLDVARFQDLLVKGRQQTVPDLRIPLLVEAVKLYRDHFLNGFTLKDAPPFNEWAYSESEEFRRNLSDALTLLVESHCSLKQAEQAVPYARRLITLDPLDEAGHRQLMQVYVQAGQDNAALKQYQTCEKILRKELGIDPQPETRALYKQIRKGEFKSIQPVKQIEMGTLQNNSRSIGGENAGNEQHNQAALGKTWTRLRKTALFLGAVLVSLLLWALIPSVIPAGALMPFPQKDAMRLHYVPAGPFIMGTDEDDGGPGGEMPVHKVMLDAYWIDETEITNGMYAKCVLTKTCQPPVHNGSAKRESYYDEKKYADYPVVYVSWNDAKTYCEWARRSLPSEAQWEKAARGTDGRTYPWGNQPPDKDLLNYNINIGDTTEVGMYPNGKSAYGAYDMAGNVWEWVADWYSSDYYAVSPPSNPLGPDSGQDRVLRGGAWGINDCGFRAADRCPLSPGVGYADIGFRCTLSFP